jgi:hypothetical protein
MMIIIILIIITERYYVLRSFISLAISRRPPYVPLTAISLGG